jgi:iron complex transport system substrate-binding protein
MTRIIRNTLSIALALALTLALALLLGACAEQGGDDSGGGAEASAATPITVIDLTGRTVTLEKPAERVVALTAASCEIVYALDAGATVVGRGEYCDWPAEVLTVPAVQSGIETNIEQIIALEPDLVLMATMNQSPEQVEQLEGAGISVYASEAPNIAETYESILQIGTLMGRDAEARELVDGMKATFDEIASHKLEGTVYFEVSPLEYGLWAAGDNTFMNEIAEIVGLENVFADLDGWAEVSEEQVLERDTDYIVTIGMHFGEGPTPDAEVLARPSWQDVTAIRDGKVLNLANNELSRPGPRLAEGAQALYDFVNGK